MYFHDITVTVSPDTLSITQIYSGSAITEKSANAFVSKTSVQTEVKIYPNPAQSLLHISGLQQNAKIFVLSSVGTIVKKITVSASRPVISISELKAGVYFLRITGSVKQPYVVSFMKD